MRTANGKINKNVLAFLVCISLFGLILSVMFATGFAKAQDNFAWRKPLVGSTFGVLCILGMSAALYPDSCSSIFVFEKKQKYETSFHNLQRTSLRGHHPDCGRFSSHVLDVGSTRLCATCSGFFVGASIALVGIVMFFFGQYSVGERPLVPMLIGATGVLLGLLHSILPGFRTGFARFMASALFAMGSFIVLASVENATRSISIDFFVITLSVLWLMTDTSLSRWDHQRICSKCPSESCSANTQ
jgi:hypothetical protein